MKRKLIIAAGTGFLGKVLSNYFKETYDIIILTRQQSKTINNITYINWDAKKMGSWQQHLENAYALINLTGKSVNCRYTNKNKATIMSSRIDSTEILNKGILMCKTPPIHFINASTATIYVDSHNKLMTEKNGDIGNDFSMTVAKTWEEAFFKTKTSNTLKTSIRTSIVLGNDGGAFPMLKKLVNLGLGGYQGNGAQKISWIHEIDFARSIAFILKKQLTGAINITAPTPISNHHFMQHLRKHSNISIGINTPTLLLKLGAKVIGTETELILKSRNVYPERLMKERFEFKYPTVESAIQNLLA
ncbi:TIGR01777 family oxidoreductase [Neptunitalea lumnitzerae]|uniref:Epimerase n=1 Tax=Neptunitalea lumnitzerae TaxID=2965509 RepID=A0ABQ5MHD7_9FLAO|nr:TIGR01777 family oxidoreductase [Neptunitalea sp. Y10]GLB48804.1 epimerase [Neptunitalea sp. Y10]